MMKEYHDARGLDMRGVPKKEKFVGAGLANIAENLWRRRNLWKAQRSRVFQSDSVCPVRSSVHGMSDVYCSGLIYKVKYAGNNS